MRYWGKLLFWKKLDFGTSGFYKVGILGKWDFEKWDFKKWDLKNLRFLESEILGNWVFVKAGFWESEILGKVDFDKVEF